MKIQIRKVNGVPMGREKNPYSQLKFFCDSWTGDAYPKCSNLTDCDCEKFSQFEQSVTEHEAPGFEEGEAEGTLVWQWKHPFDKDWQNEPIHEPYFDMNKEHEISVHQGNETRQIWITPTPEKVEVKEEPVQKFKTMDEIEINDYPNVLMDIISDLLFNSGRPGEQWLEKADPVKKREVLEEYVKQKIYEQQF